MDKFALFDFDGTIAKGDSIISFFWFSFIHKKMTVQQFVNGIWGYIKYVFHRLSDTGAKEGAIAFLQGKNQEEIKLFCNEWYQKILSKKIFKKAAQEIERLQKENYEILVITASPDVYFDAFQKEYKISAIIGTRVDKDENGLYTGRISGNNCRGLEKNLRLAEYLAAKGLWINPQTSYGYGNSHHDEAMLHLVSNPVLVNPNKKLKRAFPKAKIVKWR